MTTNDIDAIRKLTAEATPGPWTAHRDGFVWGRVLGDPVSGSSDLRDAEFIAAARTLVPALCAEVEQLRAERDCRTAQRDRLVADLADAGNEVDLLTVDLDQARAELAEVRNQAHRDAAEHQQILRDKTALANENARLRAQLKEQT